MKTFLLLVCSCLACVAAWHHNFEMLCNVGFWVALILAGDVFFERWIKVSSSESTAPPLSLTQRRAAQRWIDADSKALAACIHLAKEVDRSIKNAESRSQSPQRAFAEVRCAADTIKALIADLEAMRRGVEERLDS